MLKTFCLAALITTICACSAEVEESSSESSVDPNKEDHDTLAACVSSLACPEGGAQRIEGGSPFSMHDMECILTALMDRTPGRYSVLFKHTYTNGEAVSTLTFVIGSSGEVETAQHDRENSYGSDDPINIDDWLPTEHCALKPSVFFDSCLATFEVDPSHPTDEGWECVFPDLHTVAPWFDSCVDQSPTCP